MWLSPYPFDLVYLWRENTAIKTGLRFTHDISFYYQAELKMLVLLSIQSSYELMLYLKYYVL